MGDLGADIQPMEESGCGTTSTDSLKRLIITEVVLENFKSYAGEQRVGPFHKCFSSVVGPNGSGKSNVIDAMLFVFGKKAKQLRLNKVSELIHNSQHHRNLDTAQVSVYFQEIVDKGDEDFEVLPGTAFVVARTAHRSNASHYYVDGRKSSFGEVTALLKGKGIDLDNNRFLILQGEVEQISLMKPIAQGPHDTGLLEYLEDIIGTDSYKPQIEEGAKRLEELSEARQGVVARVKAAERERAQLEGAKAVAEAYLGKQRECTAAEAAIFQIFIRDGQRNIDKIAGNLAELEAKLKHEQDKHAAFSEDLKAAEERFQAEKREHGAVQAELDAASEAFRECERRDVKLREDAKHLGAKARKLREKQARDAAKAQALTEEAAELEGAAPELAARAAELLQKLQSEEEELARLGRGIEGEVAALRAKLGAVRAQQAPWEARAAEVRGRIGCAAAERQMLLKRQGDAQQRLTDAQEGLAAAERLASEKEAEVAAMDAAAQRHRGEAAMAKTDLDAARAEAERLSGTLREVRGTLALRRAEASAASSQSAVVGALMAARASGAIPGIRGRLGDLGAIDARYDVAVSTAAPSLDYVVVADTPTAQACVDLLRQKRLGVATFLILDKQAHLARKAAEAAATPEGVPRLYDMVRASEPDLAPAFFYALGDTLVAGDLEQASRIAYGQNRRWARVVTLQGEMVNDSGTMTGGGGKPRGGRMRLGSAAPKQASDARSQAADLAAAEKQEAANLQALAAARQRADAASAAAAAAEKLLAAAEKGAPKARLEASAARQRAADLRARLAELEAAAQVGKADKAALARLAEAVAAAEAELAPLDAELAPLQAQVKDLEKATEGAGGAPLKKQRAKVAQLQQDIATAEQDAAKKRVGAAAAGKQAEKLRKECVKTDADAAKAEADLAARKAEQKELDDQALEVMKATKAAEARLAQRAEQLAAIRSDFERKQKEVGIIRVAEVNIGNAVRDQSDSAAAERNLQKQWTRKLAAARKKLEEIHDAGDVPQPLSDADMDALEPKDLQYRVTMMEEELGRMAPDLGAVEEWRAKDAAYSQRLRDLEAATLQRNQVREEHEALRKARLDGFMAGFNAVSMKLKEMYQMITLGGDAELELVDSLDPFSEGIVFSVRPPKKSWKNIANLSGGEKTLSSLSLVFALHHYKPTPLYVMDEIDAALDYKNVSIVAHYIKERTKNAQFVIISLRNNMFELADRLVGIYKTDNATKSVTINPGAFTLRAAPAPATSAAPPQPLLAAH